MNLENRDEKIVVSIGKIPAVKLICDDRRYQIQDVMITELFFDPFTDCHYFATSDSPRLHAYFVGFRTPNGIVSMGESFNSISDFQKKRNEQLACEISRVLSYSMV